MSSCSLGKLRRGQTSNIRFPRRRGRPTWCVGRSPQEQAVQRVASLHCPRHWPPTRIGEPVMPPRTKPSSSRWRSGLSPMIVLSGTFFTSTMCSSRACRAAARRYLFTSRVGMTFFHSYRRGRELRRPFRRFCSTTHPFTHHGHMSNHEDKGLMISSWWCRRVAAMAGIRGSAWFGAAPHPQRLSGNPTGTGRAQEQHRCTHVERRAKALHRDVPLRLGGG